VEDPLSSADPRPPPRSALPFGGYKQSGFGREMGHDVPENYMNHESTTPDRLKIPRGPRALGISRGPREVGACDATNCLV
jgi:hypothetical protein